MKLGFFSGLFALFISFPFASIAAATVNTTSTPIGPCDTSCQRLDTLLQSLCIGPNDNPNNPVPCGCTNSLSSAQEACSRCVLSLSRTQTELANGTTNTHKLFDGFMNSCIAAGKPIRDIVLDDIELVNSAKRVTTVSFATPLTRSDESFPNYIAALCINPDTITPAQCIVGSVNWIRCPNSDVAGILVRISAYLANLLLGIILMFSPSESATAVWTQLLTVYSLLISGIIAIMNSNLSRFHSQMTTFLVMSPLSSTLVVYAILGTCGRPHRLDNILSGRREHLLPQILVLVYAALSLAILIFTGTAGPAHFSPNPCEDQRIYTSVFSNITSNIVFIPYGAVANVLFLILLFVEFKLPTMLVLAVAAALLPLLLVVLILIYILVKERSLLRKEFKAQSSRWRIWVIWDMIAGKYPFFHFCGVYLVPFVYWVLVIESDVLFSPDNIFAPSFGQILALFVVLPPLYQVIQMVPRAGKWVINLAWVRFISRTPKETNATELSRMQSLEEGVREKEILKTLY
ncbi:hypothetical protein R3P38DRAFT_1795951 [Favolaschia claudopus]|uniref:Uncharacterized protein n=1 Tax=Favolaschia claudopus TaxID=2862362 RepID=A0AAW0A6L0_9AGAR